MSDPRRVRRLHYRVFYRNGTQGVVWGEAELAKALARRSPAAMHHEIALRHTCVKCGTIGPWTKGWLCYPIWDRIAQYHNNATAEVIYCSQACWIEATGGFDLPSWMNTNQEPNRDRERQSAWWEANRLEGDRKRALTDHRKVPLPEWPGNGFCKWCTKRVGKGRRSWCAGCDLTYFAHAHADYQMRLLNQRDGHRCAIEGCDGSGKGFHGGLEVDHRVPLWLVAHLPDDLRRPFYGPDNLWLLCSRHHTEKTAAEAAVRAAIKRGELTPPAAPPFEPLWPLAPAWVG